MKPTAAFLAAIVIACQGAAPADSSAAQVIPGPRPTPPTIIPDVDASRRTAITDATARVAPAVVTVQTRRRSSACRSTSSSMFFGGVETQLSAGLGSGFIIREDGVIVTNAHVVAGRQHASR